jgi:hypothetical protein
MAMNRPYLMPANLINKYTKNVQLQYISQVSIKDADI